MKFDYNALKARIKEQFGTYHAFAAALGVTDGTLHRWLNNKTPMPLGALHRMVKLLEIPNIEVDSFFFRREYSSELPRELVENIGRMNSDSFNLFMRYARCLISMRTNHSAEVIRADDRLQTALKSGATLSEIAQYTEALELVLDIKPAAAVNA